MLSAMVLAAGLGTRLRPLTDVRAKALVPVGDRPVLAHLLDRLAAAGVARTIVNAHHRAAEIKEFLRVRAGVHVSEEVELLGTAGGVAHAREALGEGDILVCNADIFADVDLGALVLAHGAHAASQATLVVQPRPPGQGSVGVDRRSRVVRLRGERVADEAQGGEFLGIHVLAAELRMSLPPRGCLVGDAFIPALRRGVTLRAFLHDAPFFDIGSPGGYLDANLAWLDARAAACWVGPEARVAPSVRVERSVVGEGARAEGHGALERCVVWPGARAVAPLAGAIVAGQDAIVRAFA